MLTAKDFAQNKIENIEILANDLKHIRDRELLEYGLEKIVKLARGIEEHLEYLEVKENKDEDN